MMKRALLLFALVLPVLAVPVRAQEEVTVADFLAGKEYKSSPAVVRGVFERISSLRDLVFVIKDDSGELRVSMADKGDEASDAFKALDVRKGDTLVVSGVGAKVKANRKSRPGMGLATIISKTDSPNHDDIPAYHFSLDEKALFNGQSTNYFADWVNRQLVYPEVCRNAGQEGTVMLSFVVTEEGEVTNVEVIETSGFHPLDGEALRVVYTSPRWTPAKIKGKPVKCSFNFPVVFQLRGD